MCELTGKTKTLPAGWRTGFGKSVVVNGLSTRSLFARGAVFIPAANAPEDASGLERVGVDWEH
jgi:hypothetical protein